MARSSARPAPRRKRRRPARPETPIRNGLLLAALVAALVALIGILPSERAQLSAMGPDGQPGGFYSVPEDIPLRFSEVMSTNRGAVPDEHAKFPDWIELENTSDEPLPIGGLGLSDRKDRVLFVFPEMEVPAGGFVLVFCDGQNRTDGPELHARFKLSSRGETLYLFDRNGQMIEQLDVPAMGRNIVYALSSEGWIQTDQYTPGFPNTRSGRSTMYASAIDATRGLVINELMASNRTTLADEDGQFVDWIELHNRGVQTVDLYNVFLSDNVGRPLKWRFAKGTTIAPGAYLIVFASGKNRPGGDGLSPHTNFRLSAEGETVLLSDPYGQVIDSVTFENLGRDVSWGRTPVSPNTFREFRNPTPGRPNDQSVDDNDDA